MPPPPPPPIKKILKFWGLYFQDTRHKNYKLYLQNTEFMLAILFYTNEKHFLSKHEPLLGYMYKQY